MRRLSKSRTHAKRSKSTRPIRRIKRSKSRRRAKRSKSTRPIRRIKRSKSRKRSRRSVKGGGGFFSKDTDLDLDIDIDIKVMGVDCDDYNINDLKKMKAELIAGKKFLKPERYKKSLKFINGVISKCENEKYIW
jgi:ribosomal protein L31E